MVGASSLMGNVESTMKDLRLVEDTRSISEKKVIMKLYTNTTMKKSMSMLTEIVVG